jgi:hypothetical protein
MSFLPIENKGGHLAGIYLINTVGPTYLLLRSIDYAESVRLLQLLS